MFALRKPMNADLPTFERFRATTQRWTLDSGVLAGTVIDNVFHEDWSLTWRVVAGERQGQLGRAPMFRVRQVRADIYLMSYSAAPWRVVTATLDFAQHRLVGFETGADYCHSFSGTFSAL